MIINMIPSKLSFGAIRLDEMPKIKVGTKIREEETKAIWTVFQEPNLKRGPQKPLAGEKDPGYEVILERQGKHIYQKRPIFIGFPTKGPSEGVEQRFSIIA